MRPDEFDKIVKWVAERRLASIGFWALVLGVCIGACLMIDHAASTGNDIVWYDKPECDSLYEGPTECTKTDINRKTEWDFGIMFGWMKLAIPFLLMPILNAGLLAARRIPGYLAELPTKRERAKAARIESYESRAAVAREGVRELDRRVKQLLSEEV